MSDNESFHSATDGEEGDASDEEMTFDDDKQEPVALAMAKSSDQFMGKTDRVKENTSGLKQSEPVATEDTAGSDSFNDEHKAACESEKKRDIEMRVESATVAKPDPVADAVKPTSLQCSADEDMDGWDDWDADPNELVTPQQEMLPSSIGSEAQRGSGSADNVASLFDQAGEQFNRPASLWGGFNSFISAASDSINTITNSVGEGLASVVETVETSIGVLSPEDLAKLSIEERAALEQKADELKEPLPENEIDDCDSAEEGMSDGGSDCGFVSGETSSGYQSDSARSDPHATPLAPQQGLLYGVTSVFETTGKSLVCGGLDALESLGKKTFNALTEKDETTQRTKFILQQEKPNLSQVLRELQSKHEAEALTKEQEKEARMSNFSYLFENYQGMINLEALEMLSDNCRRQLSAACNAQQGVQQLQLIFDELHSSSSSISEDEEQDFEEDVKQCIVCLDLPVNSDKLVMTQKRHGHTVISLAAEQNSGTQVQANEINKSGMSCLAEMTASSVELFHKMSQMILLSSHVPDANIILQLCHCLCTEVGICSAKYTACLNTAADDSAEPDSVNPLITGMFLESSNSCAYIREACKLVLPVMQLRTTQV